jgi:hypothetical protein
MVHPPGLAFATASIYSEHTVTGVDLPVPSP